MPPPIVSFTKTKWLTFFAELTAKITHHNLLVVLEGCELVKRLLVCRVSVAAFLEEGNLLVLLVDSLVGHMLSSEPREFNVPIGTCEKLLFTLLETLSLFIDMMVALHADKDPYYCVLVQARAGVLLGTLVSLLQRQHPRFYGIIVIMVKGLLNIPFGRRVMQLRSPKPPSVAFECHLQQLQAAIAGHAVILQESAEILKGLGSSPDLLMRRCAQFLYNVVSKQLRHLQRSGGDEGEILFDANTLSEGDAFSGRVTQAQSGMTVEEFPAPRGGGVTSNYDSAPGPSRTSPSPPGISADGTKLSISREDTEETIVTEGANGCVSCDEYPECFERLGRSRSHSEYLCEMNSLWCLTAVAGVELQRHLTNAAFEKAFKRFLQTKPANNQDHIVFSSIILWLSHMMANHHVCDEARDSIFSFACPALIELVLRDLRTTDSVTSVDGCSTVSNSVPHTSVDNIEFTSFLSTGSSVQQPSSVHSVTSAIRGSNTKLADGLSASFLVLSFLLVAERSCGKRAIERWIRHVGLFTMIEKLIRRVAHVKSVLIDTPTTTDGVLSDEVYLSCAMNATRTEDVTLGALACKLLSSIAWDHGATIGRELASETSCMLQHIVPVLLEISIHNPTLTSAVENVSGSALHYLPSNQRAARYTSLGECSVVALDSCFGVIQRAHLNAVSLQSIVTKIQALTRATANSIHPAIRAAPYRVITRLCQSAEDVSLVACEMPSLLKAAVNSVLEYRTKMPQWEAAAAAESLIHVVTKTCHDSNVEKLFSFGRSPLRMKLLEIAASNGLTYATGTFLSLMVVLFAQQRRLNGHDEEEPFCCVLLPCGKASVENWLKLINVAIWSNERLLVACRKVVPASSTTKDAQSRALASIEGITVQYFYVSSLLRAIHLLLTAYTECRSLIPVDAMWTFLCSTFALPSPTDVLQMLVVRFGVTTDQHASMGSSYDSMLQWAIELSLLWVRSGDIGLSTNDMKNVEDSSTLASKLLDSLCRIMKDDKVGQLTRANACGMVSSIIICSGENALTPTQKNTSLATSRKVWHDALEFASAKIFEASVELEPSSCVCGMQCRLVSLFAGANEWSRGCGWFEDKLSELVKRMKDIKGRAGVLTSQGLDSLLVLFSSVFSVIAFSACPVVSKKAQQQLCTSLHSALGYEATRRAAFQMTLALTRSSEGRRCLLQEATASGDPLARTCFGRLLIMTLAESDEKVSSPVGGCRSGKNASRSTTIAEKEANRKAVRALGLEACASACAEGSEAFTHSVLKSKGVERIEALLLKCERERVEFPLSLYRLLAAISLHADAQMAIIRRKELMTVLVEMACGFSEAGTLSLLTLRNLCFNPSLKAQICQDDRILRLFKEFLRVPTTPQPLQALHPDNSSTECRSSYAASSLRGQCSVDILKVNLHQRRGKTVSFSSVPSQIDNFSILQCKELAATAYWALMYDNQRGKSHVRQTLSQSPAVKIDEIVAPVGEVDVQPSERKCVEHIIEAMGKMKKLGRSSP